MSTVQEVFVNEPAKGVPYFTPAQIPAAVTAVDPQPDGKPIPRLFQPLKIRGVEFQNRVWLSPLCQYSAKDGVPTPWIMTHLGGIIARGPGLTLTEATSVTPEGRISPEDLGIWNDEQAAALAQIVTFAHSQGQKIGIQIGHAGRKASTVAPWLSFHATAGVDQDGWPDDVVGPSAIRHSDGFALPKELTKAGIQRITQAFADGARRAVEAGFDVIEIHGAHGYLLHEFLSPIANQRNDEYGGSFENRIRLPLEVVDAVRAAIPETTPLFYRISATDRLETVLPDTPSWTVPDTIKLAHLFAAHGVDVLDVSSAGNHPNQSLPERGAEAAQADLSEAIKAALGDKLVITTVGGISNGTVAQRVLDKNQADAVFVGRHFIKNPGAAWQFAEDLGVHVTLARQMGWPFLGRAVAQWQPKKKEN